MSALGYYVPGRARAHRHSVSARTGRLHLGVSALRTSFGWHLRQGRTGVGVARHGWSVYGGAGTFEGRRDVLQSSAARLETPAWKRNRVAGDGWLAVGDAAGLVDPITGEGLYYAMRSADLAAKAILSNADSRALTGKRCGAISWATWNSARASPIAYVPRDVSVGRGSQPHGAVHAAESEVSRRDAGSVCRHAALYGLKRRLVRRT